VVRTELRADEAVLLAHALVCRLAEQVGTRVLFIKGRTAVALGARPDRPSQDVDVLVDPEGFDQVCEAIAAAGWKARFARISSSIVNVIFGAGIPSESVSSGSIVTVFDSCGRSSIPTPQSNACPSVASVKSCNAAPQRSSKGSSS